MFMWEIKVYWAETVRKFDEMTEPPTWSSGDPSPGSQTEPGHRRDTGPKEPGTRPGQTDPHPGGMTSTWQPVDILPERCFSSRMWSSSCLNSNWMWTDCSSPVPHSGSVSVCVHCLCVCVYKCLCVFTAVNRVWKNVTWDWNSTGEGTQQLCWICQRSLQKL